MSAELERMAQRAKAEPILLFTAMTHNLTEECLRESWRRLNRRGAPGVDVSMQPYAANLDANLEALVARLKRHSYRAPYVGRTYSPKTGNPEKLRPLGIPRVEDRMLQAAVARLLEPIYEADFLDCSYGFRPGRTAHQALAEVRQTVIGGASQWVVEADIKGFFDHLDHEWLMRMLELRIGDPWIIRLIPKWLKAGISDEGRETTPEEGTPQAGPLSPLLANVYLHYVLDLWFERVVRPLVRAKRLSRGLKRNREVRVQRALFLALLDAPAGHVAFPRTNASRAPEPTTAASRSAHTASRPLMAAATIFALSWDGHSAMYRPSWSFLRKFMAETKRWMRENRRLRPPRQQQILAQKLRVFYQYFALWHTLPKLAAVHRQTRRLWRDTLGRRSQRGRMRWDVWQRKPWTTLPEPRLLHRTR